MVTINIDDFSEEVRYSFICPQCSYASDSVEEPKADSVVVCESCGTAITVDESTNN